jgi:hypothetical protein
MMGDIEATAAKITWEELVQIEPRLQQLYQKVRRIKDRGGRYFCANECWYGDDDHDGLKEEMQYLVGYLTPASCDPRIRTMKAYSLAYSKLYNALPDCRNCNCGCL